jgi:hypothetical protein
MQENILNLSHSKPASLLFHLSLQINLWVLLSFFWEPAILMPIILPVFRTNQDRHVELIGTQWNGYWMKHQETQIPCPGLPTHSLGETGQGTGPISSQKPQPENEIIGLKQF